MEEIIRVGFYNKENLPNENKNTKSKKEIDIFITKLTEIEIHLANKTKTEIIECLYNYDGKNRLVYTYKNYSWPGIFKHYIDVHEIEIPENFYNFIEENSMIKIGFWKEDINDINNLPFPIQNTNKLSDEEYKLFIENLEKIEKYEAKMEDYMGSSFCRICEKNNESNEFYWKNYIWPGGYKHYLKEHKIEIPNLFYNEVKNYKVEIKEKVKEKEEKNRVKRFCEGMEYIKYE